MQKSLRIIVLPLFLSLLFSVVSIFYSYSDLGNSMQPDSLIVCNSGKETPHDSYNLDNHMHQFKGSSARWRDSSSNWKDGQLDRLNLVIDIEHFDSEPIKRFVILVQDYNFWTFTE